ncbi:hypothetical protein NDU88_011062 [Pleurodeles waltl]|uniref:Fibronectin type-II domain-containing protein n=1 Tax=Pleurodeles waltl TaxID=8319 RepID=A0AAV7S0Q9_PLEWA|nr:hypothetical protein NDU88_011062 [Pleurodeles waltl]
MLVEEARREDERHGTTVIDRAKEMRKDRNQRYLQKIHLTHQYRMRAALVTAFVCRLLLVADSAVIAINPACVFPFIYKGVTYQNCTTKDYSTEWCATTSNYDRDHRWIRCYDRAINPACVFPFIYKGVTYQNCTTKDYSTEWCATTSNYDRDHRWIGCYDRGKCNAFSPVNQVKGAHAQWITAPDKFPSQFPYIHR